MRPHGYPFDSNLEREKNATELLERADERLVQILDMIALGKFGEAADDLGKVLNYVRDAANDLEEISDE